MKITKFLTISILATGLLLTSCKRYETRSEREDNNESASDGVSAENTYNDVDNVADNAEKMGTAGFRLSAEALAARDLTGGCATITKDTVAKRITIDFGTSNCVGNDGKSRRGKIFIDYTGPYRQTGSVRNFSFDNYYVNDNKVEGSKTVTTVAGFDMTTPQWSIVVNGQLQLANNGGQVNWTANRTRKMVSGKDTPEWTDDVYTIEGSASGLSARGVNFTTQITTPLRKEVSCRWFVSGVLEHQPESKPVRKVDFGTGTCDDQATLTVRGRESTITLRR